MKTPKAPDPYQTAQAQFGGEIAAGQASGIMGNPNVYNFYGNQTYSRGEDITVMGPNGQPMTINRPTVHQNMSPAEQQIALYEQGARSNLGQTAQQQSAKLRDWLNKSIDKTGWADWNAGPKAADYALRQDQGPTDRRRIEDEMIKQYSRQADPRNEAQMAQLTARGGGYGTPIAAKAQQAQNDEFANAASTAYLASGQESRAAQDAYNQVAQARFGMGGTEADRTNALRNMQMTASYAERNQPIAEIMALLGGSGPVVSQFPSYQAQGVNAPNIAGLIGKNYEQQMAASNNFNSGLFGIGSSLLSGGLLA